MPPHVEGETGQAGELVGGAGMLDLRLLGFFRGVSMSVCSANGGYCRVDITLEPKDSADLERLVSAPEPARPVSARIALSAQPPEEQEQRARPEPTARLATLNT